MTVTATMIGSGERVMPDQASEVNADTPQPLVYVVDDDPEVRRSLQLLMESVNLAVECYGSAAEFLQGYNRARPGCLILDVRMPGMSGLELQDQLVTEGSKLPIIMITAFGEVSLAVRAMRAGAVDFVEKPFSRQELLDRVHAAIEASAAQQQKNQSRAEIAQRLGRLTDRERQVMDLMVAGHQTKEIATELGISPKTVDNHRSRVFEKTEADGVAELVWMVVRNGET
jgi:RNA polymerase sigma factor (sigma-70 family)